MSKRPRPPRGKPARFTRAPLPDRAQIMEFIASSPGKVGKREIARAFGIRGADRIALKRLLKEMADEGIIWGNRKHTHPRGKLPGITVLHITGQDLDGELTATPQNWNVATEGAPPRIVVAPQTVRTGLPVAPGDRILARLLPLEPETPEDYAFEARIIRRIGKAQESVLGVVVRRGGGLVIEPVDKKRRGQWAIQNPAGLESGQLVRAELLRRSVYGPPQARIVKQLGPMDSPHAFSQIAIETHGLPHTFPESTLDEVDALPPFSAASAGDREDLRDIPFITIDPADARDHDDAVWAEHDPDPANRNGWVVLVAIADVAHYVRPGSSTDREALKRGNSVYFPDRVVPMLPERISNDLCSLREGEERPAMVVRMVFDADGRKRRHTFARAVIRSAAKLSYQQAQAAIDGHPDEKTGPLLETVLRPLWDAHAKLAKARDKRGPLDLDLPERRILLDDQGHIRDIIIPERLEAHRLIEEMMIQANVSAAETLEQHSMPCIYRIHDAPDAERVRALRDFLHSLDISMTGGNRVTPKEFNRVLKLVAGTEYADLVNTVVLRAQAQAIYSPDNHGHFGLHLNRYAHFTSPIRRYADLTVHRGLIHALGLGDGGTTDRELAALDDIAETISAAERRAMAAERDTSDRLLAAYMESRLGAVFAATIAGVTRAGLFLRLAQTGADGLVPMSLLGDDYYSHDERRHALVGKHGGRIYRLGDKVEARLIEAAPLRGALRFELIGDNAPSTAARGKQRKKGRRRHKMAKRR